MNTFDFHRLRFQFQALDPVHFPSGKAGNMARGALGLLLRGSARFEDYARIFEPGNTLGKTPSGLAEWPRPFVLRAAHLDGITAPSGGRFFLDVHLFDPRPEAWTLFRTAFAELARHGIGEKRGRAELVAVETVDLEDGAQALDLGGSGAGPPLAVSLDPGPDAVSRVAIRFATPTELKSGGGIAERPEFPILFARLRDRLSTLRALYGAGPLDIDFRSMGGRAAAVRLNHCELVWEAVKRRSGRTGQVHSIGGFTGSAEYEGELREFVPWLRAARWIGVGRQTVWGKGDVRVESVGV